MQGRPMGGLLRFGGHGLLCRQGVAMLQFDDKTAALLETAYQGADFRRRRRASFDALAPRPGQRIADIGCGNGWLTLELALAVGETGQVIGVDPSADMLALARQRTTGMPQVRLVEGPAESLPLEDGSLDGALSVQVFEYLPETAGALAGIRRALRSGGRLVIGDMHFGTLAWHSDDPARMARMIESWNAHVADVASAASLVPAIRDAGFEVTGVRPVTTVDTDLRPDGLARMMLILMESYAVSQGHVPADEARAWAEEQEALAREGRFFHTLTHFVISARRT